MEGVSPPTTLAPIHSENSLTLSNFKLFRKNPGFEEITIGGLGVQKGGQPTKVGQSSLSPAQSFRASSLVGKAEALSEPHRAMFLQGSVGCA